MNLIFILKIIKILNIVTAVQSIIYGCVFTFNSFKNKACVFIGLFLFIIGFNNLGSLVLEFSPKYFEYDATSIPLFFTCFSIPLLYLYIHRIFGLQISFKKKLILIPGIIEFLHVLLALNGIFIANKTTAFLIFIFGFNFIIILMIINFLIKIRINQTNKESVNRLKKIITIYLILFMILHVFKALNLEVYSRLLMSVLNFFFITSIIFFELKRSDLIGLGEKKIVKEKRALNLSECEKYAAIINNLNTFLESTKYYKNINITIFDISRELNIDSKLISKAINTIYGDNFNTYINLYRVEEARELLTSATHKYFTVEAISQEVGFKSKSAFYRAFYKIEKQTPSEFKKNNTLQV